MIAVRPVTDITFHPQRRHSDVLHSRLAPDYLSRPSLLHQPGKITNKCRENVQPRMEKNYWCLFSVRTFAPLRCETLKERKKYKGCCCVHEHGESNYNKSVVVVMSERRGL